MSGLFAAALAWPVLLLPIGLLLGRLLRSADRVEEARRTELSRTVALLTRLGQRNEGSPPTAAAGLRAGSE